jgi:hypothetical protein
MHTPEFFNQKYDEIIKLINDCKSTITQIMSLVKKNFHFNDFLIKIKNNVEMFKKFIYKCDIEYEVFDILVNCVNDASKGKYREIYCVEYKLILILQIIDNYTKWKSLTTSIFYEPHNNSKHHFKSLCAQYYRWCKNDVFKNALNKIVPINNDIKLNDDTTDDIYYDIDNDKDLFIDTTFINNKHGSEGVVVNPELTKKNVTKLGTVSNIDGFVFAITYIDGHDKVITFNKKKRNIKTACHDSKTIKQTLNEINPNINIQTNEINLIGDKGYKTSDVITYNNKNVTMITPNKINQKQKLIKKRDAIKMKFRYIVENTIQGFKKNSRVYTRHDKKIKTYLGWVYISCLMHNIKVNKRVYNEINKKENQINNLNT